VPEPEGGELSDAQLAELLLEHLSVDAVSSLRGSVRAKPVAASREEALTVESFVSSMLPLIELERDAEKEAAEELLAGMRPETAASRGQAILGLRCTGTEPGLLGKTVLTLELAKGGGGQPLPPHKVTPHDVVALRPSKSLASSGNDAASAALASGVVYRVSETFISVAVDELPDEGLEGMSVRLEKLANEVTYQRLRMTLERLSAKASGSGLAAVCFGRASPRVAANREAFAFEPMLPGLDASQMEAASFALASLDVALIHGPPGTGKTTTVLEVIAQSVKRGCKVLACAASNIAVDNLTERLVRVTRGAKVVRVGHPARLLPSVLEASLEAHVLRSDNSALASDVRKEQKELSSRLLKLDRWKRKEAKEIKFELRRLQKEERQRQQAAVTEVLSAADVISTTLTGVSSRQLKDLEFDLVVIDEAAQALEAACWGALLKGKRAVLAGDHLQLPPTVVSDAAEKQGLGRTLFERLHAMHGENVARMLNVQYRMNARIMRWSSDELYDGLLSAHSSVATHTLSSGGKIGSSSDGAEAAEAVAPVLLVVDTAGCDMPEYAEEEGDSKQNEGEARVVLAHAQALIAAGVRAEDIGIITPYRAQVGLLRERRAEAGAALEALEVSTVDGFQGREKEAILISMVRSNDAGEVGFLSDARRMNVAVTRARRHCAIVCDTETVGKNKFLARLLAYFEANGEYRSAMELEGSSPS